MIQKIADQMIFDVVVLLLVGGSRIEALRDALSNDELSFSRFVGSLRFSWKGTSTSLIYKKNYQ
jgi:hypothetical protein